MGCNRIGELCFLQQAHIITLHRHEQCSIKICVAHTHTFATEYELKSLIFVYSII